MNLYADRLRPLVITFFIFFILRQGRYGLVLGADLVLDQTLADNHVQSFVIVETDFCLHTRFLISTNSLIRHHFLS